MASTSIVISTFLATTTPRPGIGAFQLTPKSSRLIRVVARKPSALFLLALDRAQRVVYRNLGNGSFEEVSDLCGPAVLEPHSSRGCAFGDFDDDGNIDVLIMNMSEPPSLLRNNNRTDNHWLVVKVVGTRSNRSAIGARVTVTAGGRRQIREVLSGSSYLSQSDLRQHFGLRQARMVDQIEVRWPSGGVDRVGHIEPDQFVTIEEGRGLVAARRYR